MTRPHVQNLQRILSSSSSSSSPDTSVLFLTSREDTIAYCTDWTKQYSFPHPHHANHETGGGDEETLALTLLCVAQPRTVTQVSQIITYCYQHGIPVIPLGGRTGLVGGTLPRITKSPDDGGNNQDHDHDTDDSIMRPPPSASPAASLPQYPLELLLSTRFLRDNAADGTLWRMTPHGILQCGAGYTLQEVQDYARGGVDGSGNDTDPTAYTVPIDIGSKGTCTMGGVVATNAGGQYYYRYQSLMANIIGLQCVTGTGKILNWNYGGAADPLASDTNHHHNHSVAAANFKDNTGYKLYPLLIGSEGTLGIITGITMKCTPHLPIRRTMMVTITSKFRRSTTPSTIGDGDDHRHHDNDIMTHLLQIVQAAQRTFGEILAAVEWMDPNCLHVIAQSYQNDTSQRSKLHRLLSFPEVQDCTEKSLYPHSLLIETHGTTLEHDEEKCLEFGNLLLEMNEDGTNSDSAANSRNPFRVGVSVAKNETDAKYFWSIRESANPSVTRLGYTYKYDVSIPNSDFSLLIAPIRERLYRKYTTDRIVVSNWGHVLDGNLHLNITDVGNHQRDTELVSILEPFIYEEVMRLGGSISAEHGIGQMKVPYMNQIHDPVTLQMMHSIKKVFDPAGIMNPGKVLPELAS